MICHRNWIPPVIYLYPFVPLYIYANLQQSLYSFNTEPNISSCLFSQKLDGRLSPFQNTFSTTNFPVNLTSYLSMWLLSIYDTTHYLSFGDFLKINLLFHQSIL